MALKKLVSIGTVAVVIFIASPALAERTQGNTALQFTMGPAGMMRGKAQIKKPAIIGSVSAISGTTLTLNGRVTPGNNATTTFNVDVSNAKIFKGKATSTISSIKVGDMIFVEGTVSGTNVTAIAIRDGVRGVGFGPGKRDDHASSTPAFMGNGQPLVAGKISAVSGNTLTLTTGNNVVYTVDATNAKIVSGKNSAVLSSITSGDAVMIQGTVNGSTVTATTIIERLMPEKSNGQSPELNHGMFENVGGFFKHLFGFK